MNTIRTFSCLLIFAVSIGTASAQTPPDADSDPARMQAEAAAAEFSKRLKQTLMTALAEAGPIGGIDACHAEAPRIAADVERVYGVTIGRAGVRNRDADNAAEGWQRERLEAFEQRAAAGEAPESLRHIERSADGRVLRMARGIRTEAACQMCHGAAVPAEIEASIQKHYPDDRATGFTEGSLRGLLWVEAPIDSAR